MNSTNYLVTSCKDPRYNCLAWAVGDISKKWDPIEGVRGYYWPPGIGREGTVNECAEVFILHGYTNSDTPRPELGYEKVAIFEDENGWSHIARQLRDGKWSSKLGKGADIEHLYLESLEGPDPAYGKHVRYLKRQRPDWDGK